MNIALHRGLIPLICLVTLGLVQGATPPEKKAEAPWQEWAPKLVTTNPPVFEDMHAFGTNALPVLLSEFDYPHTNLLTDIVAGQRHMAAFDALWKLGPLASNAVPHLRVLLDNPQLGYDTAQLLSHMGRVSFTALIGALTNGSSLARYHALTTAFDEWGSDSAHGLLLRAVVNCLPDTNVVLTGGLNYTLSPSGLLHDTVRFRALEKLEYIKDAGDAVPALLRLLADPDADTRSHAAGVLAKVGKASIVETGLVPLLADPVPKVRWAAVYWLGRINSSAAAPAVAPLLADPDYNVRAAATNALHQLKSR